MRDGKEYPAIIHLNEGSILAGLNELHKNEVPGAADVMMDTVQVPLSLLTYLCSDDPDYGADRVPPTRAIPKNQKEAINGSLNSVLMSGKSVRASARQ